MHALLSKLGLSETNVGTQGAQEFKAEGEQLVSTSPIDNSVLGNVACTTEAQYEQVITQLKDTFTEWRKVPAPQRGEIV
ncbi:MAG: aldehyde dehydrogenase family protein, partial [Bdellovibrionales bacterium]|nr:aldehyde dehydrogenase family protein [Bdellovibrionales bacterium]